MSLVIKLLISLGLLAGIVWMFGGIDKLLRVMAGIDVRYVILAVAVSTADRALMTFKWVWLLKGRGVLLPLFKGMKIYCAAMIWSSFLPSTIGSDVIRAVCTSRAGLDYKEVVASIVIERMIGFLSALVLGLVGVVLLSQLTSLGPQLQGVLWMGGLVLLGAAMLFAASFSHKPYELLHDRLFSRLQHMGVFKRIRDVHSTYMSYESGRAGLVKFFGMTLAEQMLTILFAWIIARGLGVDVGLLYVAGALPLAVLVSQLPISINGLGLFEGVFAALMSLAGVPPEASIAIALIGRILQVVSWLPWWLAYVIERGKIGRPTVAAGGP
ncbi:MAG: lysylphosphatidylglycerol synthase transmembrane domain-containing protein [Arenicellales bacterium]